MAIYLKIPKIEGSVTSKGLEKTIPLLTFHFHIDRKITTKLGHSTNREFSLPRFSAIKITKIVDKSSSLLLTQILNGRVIPEAKLLLCHPGDNNQPYLEYTLTNVLISHFEEDIQGDADTHVEMYHFNFTKFERKYIERDNVHKMGAPLTSGFDLTLIKQL